MNTPDNVAAILRLFARKPHRTVYIVRPLLITVVAAALIMVPRVMNVIAGD